MLKEVSSVISEVIKGKPTLQYCVQNYRGDPLLEKDNNYNKNFDVRYITYFQNAQHIHDLNADQATRTFFKESEYMSLRLRPVESSPQQKYIFQRFRRRAQVLRKQQLEIMNDYDEELIEHKNLDLEYQNTWP